MASNRQQELSDQLAKVDSFLSEARAQLDSAARGRRYRVLADTAEALAKRAKLGAELSAELDKLLEAAWKERRGA